MHPIGLGRVQSTHCDARAKGVEKGMKLAKPLLALLIALCVIPFLDGYVIAKLWGYFVVTIGAPPISMLQGMGLNMLYQAFAYRPLQTTDAKKKEAILTTTVTHAVMLLLVWGIGALIHWGMQS